MVLTFTILLLIFSPMIIGTLVLGWQKKIKVKHNESGIQKNCFVGYSWTYFFFGFFFQEIAAPGSFGPETWPKRRFSDKRGGCTDCERQ